MTRRVEVSSSLVSLRMSSMIRAPLPWSSGAGRLVDQENARVVRRREGSPLGSYWPFGAQSAYFSDDEFIYVAWRKESTR